MSGRTDTHQLTVSQTETGQRYSTTGTQKECQEAAALKQKEWGKSKTTVEIHKR